MRNGAGITRASRPPAIECPKTQSEKFFVIGGRYGDDIVQKIEYLAYCAIPARGISVREGGPSLGRMVQRRGFNAAGALTSQKIAIAKRRFKDQRRISWQGVGPAIFLGQSPTGRSTTIVGASVPKWDGVGLYSDLGIAEISTPMGTNVCSAHCMPNGFTNPSSVTKWLT
jgi:hypothetical protein